MISNISCWSFLKPCHRRVIQGHVEKLSGVRNSFATYSANDEIPQTIMTNRTAELANKILVSDAAGSKVSPTSENILQRRLALSRAITLIESKSPKHVEQANLLLNRVTKKYKTATNTGNVEETNNEGTSRTSFRVGIAGAPGAGKSSFIETFGKFILNDLPQAQNDQTDETDSSPNKLAVVCVDPSSSITGGSILGDKTRMMDLSRHPKAFVRPSPSRGVLGGLSSYTNDVVSLCEAAGYDLILVETVGLGQSEIDISQTVDMLVLLVSPGSGDGLQVSVNGSRLF
jgi:LAO/AO transport system kinase